MKCRTFTAGFLQMAVPVYKIATAQHFPAPKLEEYLSIKDVHRVNPATRTTVGMTLDSPKK